MTHISKTPARGTAAPVVIGLLSTVALLGAAPSVAHASQADTPTCISPSGMLISELDPLGHRGGPSGGLDDDGFNPGDDRCIYFPQN